MDTLIIASSNKGKINEFKSILKDKYKIISLDEIGFNGEIIECGTTFYENALIKAKTVSEIYNIDCLADDSGLCVEALNWGPGINTARYAGEHGNSDKNIELLLKNLKHSNNRYAKFCCQLVLYKKKGEVITGYGETEGYILEKKEGSNGFGYDPVFFSLELNKSFGVSSSDEKNEVSHRKKAIYDLIKKL